MKLSCDIALRRAPAKASAFDETSSIDAFLWKRRINASRAVAGARNTLSTTTDFQNVEIGPRAADGSEPQRHLLILIIFIHAFEQCISWFMMEQYSPSHILLLNLRFSSGAIVTNRFNILVAEDELIVQAVTQSVLEQNGFEVVCASSTQEALQIVESEVALAAVFLDIDIGDKGGGYRVARLVRALHPEIPIIYTSGGDLREFERQRVADADFVPKPYSPERVSDLIEQRLTA